MSSYTKTTDFNAKDALPTGNANKIVRGAEIDDEFDNIATAVNSKSDTASPTFTGTVTIPTVDINAGNVEATIGATTPAAGTFTTIVAGTSVTTDLISEESAGAGVTIDGLLIKDSGIPEAAVTAHEAALTITESQISDLGTYEAADAAIVKSDEAETISAGWTFSGSVTLNGEVIEQDNAHSQSGATLVLDPANGLIQRITLTQSVTTVTDNLANGEYVSLHILDGASAYAITWPAAWKWAGGATPTLDTSDMNVIEVWRANSVTYAASVGVMTSA